MTQYAYNPTTNDTLVFNNLKEVGKHFGVPFHTLRDWAYHGRPLLELPDKEIDVRTENNNELMQGYEVFSENEWREYFE